MNHLAHGLAVLESPYELCGTALPDWLRMINRRTRIRARPARDDEDAIVRAVASGVTRHERDDAWFHSDADVEAVTHDAVARLRASSPDPRFRASTFGHIAVEVLFDAFLASHTPGAVDAYYAAVAAVNPEELTRATSALTREPVPRLRPWLARFASARILDWYASDDGVVRALSGVALRIGLPALPPSSESIIAAVRVEVMRAAPAWRARLLASDAPVPPAS